MSDTNYNKPVQQWLDDHGIKFRATLSDSKPAAWQPSGHHYRITLSKRGHGRSYDNQPKRLTFDFWSSKADMDAGIKTVGCYSVLDCVALDSGCPDTLSEFVGNYGGNEDSIKTLQTFKRAKRFADRLNSFFTAEELESLRETLNAI
jgi:hypothetical protein